MKAVVVVAVLAAAAFALVFEPAELGCAFKMYIDEYEDIVMMPDNNSGYVKMINHTDDSLELINCDIKNEDGECRYVRYLGTDRCVEEWMDESDYDHNTSWYYYFLREPFQYTRKENVDCPAADDEEDGNHTSTGCSIYINDNNEFIIADSDKRIVLMSMDGDNWTITYSDDVPTPADMTNFTYCNKTAMNVENVCPAPPPPPASSSKTPTPASSSKAPAPASSSKAPAPASSSKAPSPTPASSSKSYASTVYPAFALLAAALVALLF